MKEAFLAWIDQLLDAPPLAVPEINVVPAREGDECTCEDCMPAGERS